MHIANFAINITIIRYSATDTARSTKFDSKHASVDLYSNSMFKGQKGVAYGHVTQFPNSGTTYSVCSALAYVNPNKN